MKLYITCDTIGIKTCGGSVTKNELDALKSLGDSVAHLDAEDLTPTEFGIGDSPFLIDYLALDKISELDMENIKIDLAHLYGGPFTQTIRLLKAKGVKTTYTVAAHDRKLSIEEFGNLGMEYPFNHVKDDKLWTMYNNGAREADVVITPSKKSAEFLKNEGCKRVEIIPHGCEIPDENKIIPILDEFSVGYLGQTRPDKGLKYLIEAWSELNYKNSTLIFAGRGIEQFGGFINKYATTGRFHLMGWIENKADFFNNISVYIQPSITEAFGIEVLEAAIYKRPIICSNGTGSIDLIEDGVNGFVVHKRDPKAIADKIDWLKSHPKELVEMGEMACNIAKEYSWDNIRQKYIDLWESL